MSSTLGWFRVWWQPLGLNTFTGGEVAIRGADTLDRVCVGCSVLALRIYSRVLTARKRWKASANFCQPAQTVAPERWANCAYSSLSLLVWDGRSRCGLGGVSDARSKSKPIRSSVSQDKHLKSTQRSPNMTASQSCTWLARRAERVGGVISAQRDKKSSTHKLCLDPPV